MRIREFHGKRTGLSGPLIDAMFCMGGLLIGWRGE